MRTLDFYTRIRIRLGVVYPISYDLLLAIAKKKQRNWSIDITQPFRKGCVISIDQLRCFSRCKREKKNKQTTVLIRIGV